MTASRGDESAQHALLAALAAPAVLLDGGGLVASWNGEAEARFGLTADGCGQPLADLVGWLADAGRSVPLADGAGSLVVWSLDDDGLGPDDIELQKGDVLGRVAGGVKHDLQNKYQVITGLCELVGTDPSIPADLREMTDRLAETAAVARDVTITALEQVRHSPPRLELVSVGLAVRKIVETLAFAVVDLELRVTVPDSLPQVEAEPTLLRQALIALVVNAVEAQGGTWGSPHRAANGRLLISGSARVDAMGRRIRLAIEDGGEVVPIAARATLFSGTGGGRAGRDLAVARAIITRAGGRLTYEAVPNGNRIVVELPVAGTALPPRPSVAAGQDAAPTSEVARPLVLICDDEAFIRGLLARLLERLGVAVLEARDGREALAALETNRVSVIVSDQQMPDISGSELFDLVVARQPELASRFILASGDPGSAEVAAFLARTGVPVLPKPFDHERLAALIWDAIAQ